MNAAMRRKLRAGVGVVGVVLQTCGVPARAADLVDSSAGIAVPLPAGPPRYFPRSDGSERRVSRTSPRPLALGCVPRRAAVPTNAPDDPSYVGSTYGLSRPSYYGLTPPPGIGDPFGRALLPYCP